MQTSRPQPVKDFTLDYTRMGSGLPLVERDFAPRILWHWSHDRVSRCGAALRPFPSEPGLTSADYCLGAIHHLELGEDVRDVVAHGL